MLLDKQVMALAEEAFHQLQLVCQLLLFVEKWDLVIVTRAFVTSILEYFNRVYMENHTETSAGAEFYRASRFLLVTPILQELQGFPIAFHPQFKLLVLLFKALNSLGPGFLKEHLSQNHPLMHSVPQRRSSFLFLKWGRSGGRAQSIGPFGLWPPYCGTPCSGLLFRLQLC